MTRIDEKYIRAALKDLRLFLTGRADPELPPHRYRRVGKGDFRERGEWLASLLVRNGLRPEHHVLDIGCGIGRVAMALTRYTTATYRGFDIDRRAVNWCQTHITPERPNFQFTHADVLNPHYNRRGIPASRYSFPYENESFDFAYATSVFGHLDFDAAANYFHEANRVLRPGGILLATVFLFDRESPHFAHDRGEYRLRNADDPGAGIAFDATRLDRLLPPERWAAIEIQRGSWQDGPFAFAVKNQDVIVARR